MLTTRQARELSALAAATAQSRRRRALTLRRRRDVSGPTGEAAQVSRRRTLTRHEGAHTSAVAVCSQRLEQVVQGGEQGGPGGDDQIGSSSASPQACDDRARLTGDEAARREVPRR